MVSIEKRLDAFDILVDHLIEMEDIGYVIDLLMDIGFDEDELIEMNFDKEFIDDVIKERGMSNE